MSTSIYSYQLSHLAGNEYTGSVVASNSALAAIGCVNITAMTCDQSGNIYLSDSASNAIFKVFSGGRCVLYAGLPGTRGNNGGSRVQALDARFNAPSGIFCDKSGIVYVADSNNHQIRKIFPNGFVVLVAGDPNCTKGFVGGNISNSRFSYPYDVTCDSGGNIFIADTMNHAIRVIRGDKVYTMVGNGTAGNVNGNALTARINKPFSILPKRNERIYFSESEGYCMKMFNGTSLYRFSGSGEYGSLVLGPLDSQYHNLKYCDIDNAGSIYVIDVDQRGTNDSRIVRISDNGQPRVIVHFEDAKDNIVKCLSIDRSNKINVGCSSWVELLSNDGSDIYLTESTSLDGFLLT
ncbi:MAG: hypothetical protein WC375_04265 [Methanomassiliicoccales archaeon]|jgi:hypothetical protein